MLLSVKEPQTYHGEQGKNVADSRSADGAWYTESIGITGFKELGGGKRPRYSTSSIALVQACGYPMSQCGYLSCKVFVMC